MQRLLKLNLLTSIISCSVFGQTFTFSGGPLPENIQSISTGLGAVRAIAVDSAGNIFMGLTDYHQVLRWNKSSGALTLVAGSGTFGYTGDNGPATGAQLETLSAIAVDTAGNLYIADDYSAVIRKVSTNGIITTFAGTGTPGFSGDHGPATSAQLTSPSGLAVDAEGSLYISDLNNRVRKVSNGLITTVAGNGKRGSSGDGGPATNAELNSPSGLAVDAAGNIYIADRSNRVREISNGVITTVAGNGTSGFSGDGGPAVNAQLTSPSGVAVDAEGNLYITERGNRIRQVSNGVITTVAGTGMPGFSGDGGPATGALLTTPTGLAVDAAGNLFIGDPANHRIRRISNGTITTVAGGGPAVGDNGSAASTVIGASTGSKASSAPPSSGSILASTDLSDSAHLIRDNVSSTMIGSYDVSGGSWKPPARTVATLPPAGANAGKAFLVVDGRSAGDCSFGRGSALTECYSNGSVWLSTTPNLPYSNTIAHHSFRALCQNTVAGANFSLLPGISSNPAIQNCDPSNYFGGLSFAANTSPSTSNDAYGMVYLPPTWSNTANVSANLKWRTVGTSGSVVFQLSGQCVAPGGKPGNFGAPLPFPASPAAGLAFGWTDATGMTLTTANVMSGCVAGDVFLFRIFRDHTTGGDTLPVGADLILLDLAVVQ
jgi:hypothetical protein